MVYRAIDVLAVAAGYGDVDKLGSGWRVDYDDELFLSRRGGYGTRAD